MSTTTPNRQTTLTSPKSTPGSAARSKDLATTGLEVHAVGSWIARHLENAQICDVDLILKSFILDCMVDEFSTTERVNSLFHTCPDRVLPVCNNADVRNHLTAYSEATSEMALCSHFVCAANTALSHLQDLGEFDDLWKPSQRLVFQVHDKEKWDSYQGADSVREPGVVLVSADRVRGGVQENVLATVKQPPDEFSWREVRTVIEFKSWRKTDPPPSQYTNESYILSHKHLSPKAFVNGSASASETLSREKPEAASNNCGGGPGISDNTATQKRKAAPSDTKREPLPEVGEQSNDGFGSTSKRRRTQHSDTDANEVADTQTGTYGAEMFASHLGRQHVICLSITGDVLYIWRYDRQGVIRCTPLNFIQDLPRFLVLLLAMQRFQDRHWGLNPVIDPRFGRHSADSEMAVIGDGQEGQVDLVFDWSWEKRTCDYDLAGRATNVVPVTSQKFASRGKMVAKVFWAEVSRTSEPDILKKVYEIAEKEPDVRNHVPAMVFHHRFSNSSTAVIRSRLGLPTEGARALFLILFEELMEITELTGEPFLQCWWQAVKCHLALWKNGVHHRDVSASNLMYKDREGHPIGILNDFDSATTAQAPTGNKRTGTIPFMALELLTEEDQAEKIEHVYVHDAEAFIWVLVWICSRYGQGVLLSNPPLDSWAEVSAIDCAKTKLFYLRFYDQYFKPSKGHERSSLAAKRCLIALRHQIFSRATLNETFDDTFKRLLAEPYEQARKDEAKGQETAILE